MWLKQAALIVLLVSRIAMMLFTLDILAWTFGLTIIPPLEALLRLSIWAAPSLFPFFFSQLSEYLRKPIVEFLREIPVKEIVEETK